jgi:predicted amidohydrolase YtcJ
LEKYLSSDDKQELVILNVARNREEALRAATTGGAYVMFAEDILGSIEVGKLADFVVIPVDYMTIPAEDIWKIEPDMTVIGSEVVYTKPVPAQK